MANHSIQDNFSVSPRHHVPYQTWKTFPHSGQIGKYDTAIAIASPNGRMKYSLLKTGDFKPIKHPGRKRLLKLTEQVLNPAYPAAADCPVLMGSTHRPANVDQGKIHGFRSVERDLMLPFIYSMTQTDIAG